MVAGTVEPQAMAALAAALPASAWSQQTIQEGSQGPLVAAFATLRVMSVRAGLPGPKGWWILRRHVHTGALKTSLSNAPADTPLTTLVRMSGRRWPIETGCEDGTPYLGMGDDEVRSWRGWHHHMTWCMLDHCFLVRLQCRFKKTTVVKLTREAPKAVPTQPNMPLNHDARANIDSASRSAAGD